MKSKRNLKRKALKTLADLITQTEECKQFCFGYAEIFLDIFIRLIQEKEIQDKEIDSIATIISLGERA